MAVLTLYSSSWCPECRAAKQVLDEKGITYNEVEVDGNEAAIKLITEARGKRVVPTLEYNGAFMDGNHFNRAKFEKELEELLA